MNHFPQPSFAAAFNDLFADIFGPKPPKPRIRKTDPWHWVAVGAGITRYGLCPGMAYEMWRRAWRDSTDQKAAA